MKILIYTASAGNGHNSAANRIKETISSNYPDFDVKIIDGYQKYSSKIKNFIQTKGYLWICNHGVKLYNYFFKKEELKEFSNADKNSIHKTVKHLKKGMLDDINQLKPDLIISTYIYCSVALSDLKKEKNLSVKTASLMLDYGISPFWECISKNTDYMFLTNNQYIEEFEKRGFRKENLFPTGIPISSVFSQLPSREVACKKLNLDSNLFTLTIMKSGFFSIKDADIIKSIKKIKKPIQIVIINGKSTASKERIDKMLKKVQVHHKIINLGFTKDIPAYFACSDVVLGKAGGLTTTECVTSCIPLLIVDKLPQQEIYNKQYMIDNNVALSVTKSNLADIVNSLIDDEQLLQTMKDNCKKIRITYSTEKMCEILMGKSKN